MQHQLRRRSRVTRRLMLSLVHVAPDIADTRRRVTTTELLADHGDAQATEMEDALDRFVAQRLVTAHADTVEISHEALLTAWPQLRTWLDTDRTGLVIGRQLADAATTWRREHRTARLWDVTDPRQPDLLSTLTGHSGGLNAAMFSPRRAHSGYRQQRPHRAAVEHRHRRHSQTSLRSRLPPNHQR